ncbi:sensor domain-containing diguanylate cyclase [Marinimicrobium sp. ABcell2]|uniref:GGDEF domain-containing protein n=1 Tax=Marinimicrobium sp. ABcell2 TaxID=3069751 RepID=UPI0027B48D1A|nr:sensor domain-containing diguanylate cyclase [Marinimicrobium sp. ABcell2]MDQ2077634.1 sensor domain-containing diguanylate cyclase [Marinimicrobium sp. ABcell2]
MADLELGLAGHIQAPGRRGPEFDRSLLRAIQEASPDGILVVDEQGVVVSYNQRFIETWKISIDHLDYHSSDDGTVPEDRLMHAALAQLKDPDAFIKRVMELYATPSARDHCELELKDGRVLERHSVGLHNDLNRYLGRVWFFRDITERKRVEAALRELAWRDQLTGEMSRGHFLSCASDELARAKRYRHPLAILMIDLDHFKSINDRYGHAAGDVVLVTVCQRWRDVLREGDLLGRIGGEEFAILLPNSDREATQKVAERLRACVAEPSIQVFDDEIACTVSGGIAMVDVDQGSIDNALSRADDALYRAKHKGRNRMEMDGAG